VLRLIGCGRTSGPDDSTSRAGAAEFLVLETTAPPSDDEFIEVFDFERG